MSRQRKEKWMQATLVAAGIYHILWGAAVVLFPAFWFRLAGLMPPDYPQLWQAVGMMSGIFGIGFLIAATNPLRHWTLILVGLLIKIAGPAGFLYYFAMGALPGEIFRMFITNDLIWWIPFSMILYRVYSDNYRLDEDMIGLHDMPYEDLLDIHRTTSGKSLYEMSYEQPVMIVFLRHLGCTFCRESLAHIAAQRKGIEAEHTQIAIVYQVEEKEARPMISKYGLNGVNEISDPEGMLYKGFKLKRGTISQLINPRVIFRGIIAGLFNGHGIGKEMGDLFQMPGVFVLYKGEIVNQFIHRTAADIPPYLELAHCEQCV